MTANISIFSDIEPSLVHIQAFLQLQDLLCYFKAKLNIVSTYIIIYCELNAMS